MRVRLRRLGWLQVLSRPRALPNWTPGWETPTSAGLGDCFEHALTASNSPRIAKPAIIASFCWRDQDESVVPEIVLLVAWLVDLWLVDFWSVDFQIVAIFVTSSAAGAVGSDMARERPTR